MTSIEWTFSNESRRNHLKAELPDVTFEKGLINT